MAAAAAAAAQAAVRLTELPGPGRLFFLTSGRRLADRLMLEGLKHERLFFLNLGPMKFAVATHPEVARDIIMRPKDFPKMPPLQPPRISDKLNQDAEGNFQNIVAANGEHWRSLHDPLAPAFERKAINPLKTLFGEVSDRLIEKWLRKGEVDAKDDMSAFAIDVLGSTVLGRDFGAVSGQFGETYEKYKYITMEATNAPYMVFPWLEKLPLPRNRRLREAVDHVQGVLRECVDVRVAERHAAKERGEPEAEPKDVLDMVLGFGCNAGQGLQPAQILPVLWIFFLAGHDTTAIALAWMCYHLATHPEIQARARAEILAVTAGSGDATAKQLDSEMPYLNALIKENLRLRPPVYNIPTRYCPQDTLLDGVLLPKGSFVSVHIGAVNRNADVYREPHVFNPDRFLHGKRIRTFEHLPFMAGPRRCLGDKFSLLEQKVLLCRLLARAEILPGKGFKEDLQLSAESVPLLFGQPMQVPIEVRAL